MAHWQVMVDFIFALNLALQIIDGEQSIMACWWGVGADDCIMSTLYPTLGIIEGEVSIMHWLNDGADPPLLSILNHRV